PRGPSAWSIPDSPCGKTHDDPGKCCDAEHQRSCPAGTEAPCDERECSQAQASKASAARVIDGVGAAIVLLYQGEARRKDCRKGEEEPANARAEVMRHQACSCRDGAAKDETHDPLPRGGLAYLSRYELRFHEWNP